MQAVHAREIGAQRKRVEDPRLVRGEGQYVDDLRLPGTVEVVFVRSDLRPRPTHRVDLSAAQAAPGCWPPGTASGQRRLPRVPNRIPIEGSNVSPLPPLAHATGHHAGYPVAVVAAARTVPGPRRRRPGRDRLRSAAGRHRRRAGAGAGRAAALARARHQRRLPRREGGRRRRRRLRSAPSTPSRCGWSTAGLAQVPMEPRGILASYDREQRPPDRLALDPVAVRDPQTAGAGARPTRPIRSA